jgi:hypothetical protein
MACLYCELCWLWSGVFLVLLIIVIFQRAARASRDACWRRLHGSVACEVADGVVVVIDAATYYSSLDVLLEAKQSISIAYTCTSAISNDCYG